MFIEIRELQLHPVDFAEDLGPGVIDFGPDLHQVDALHAAGRVQLVEEHRGKHKIIQDIRVDGSLRGKMALPCARCLEPVVREVKRDFDLLYRPLGADAGLEERSVSVTEAEVSYHEGDGLLLEDVLREQVLLALPLKAVCNEDCRGLCPQCGANLNQEQCSCKELAEDPRWSALKDIRAKLEQ
ncbi:MAG TPA: DUF177 domain-containing protein [Terriglobales bacterium]|nr:DUF177 domain-containing protein [Terriglobales bacterium]